MVVHKNLYTLLTEHIQKGLPLETKYDLQNLIIDMQSDAQYFGEPALFLFKLLSSAVEYLFLCNNPVDIMAYRYCCTFTNLQNSFFYTNGEVRIIYLFMNIFCVPENTNYISH